SFPTKIILSKASQVEGLNTLSPMLFQSLHTSFILSQLESLNGIKEKITERVSIGREGMVFGLSFILFTAFSVLFVFRYVSFFANVKQMSPSVQLEFNL